MEPTLAMDPGDPDHIVVAAQYGAGYNRGGLRFWAWNSRDGGISWAGSEAVPRILQEPPSMAADATLTFDVSGRVLLTGLYGGGIWEGTGVPRAAIAVAVSDDGSEPFRPQDLFAEELQISPTHFVGSDKPWTATDISPDSPFSGTLYVSWSRVTVRLGEETPSVSRDLVLSFRRPGGVASVPRVVAGGGHAGQIAVSADGTLDVLWMDGGEGDGSVAQLLHAYSSDGGASFSTPVVVESLSDTTQVIGLSSLAVTQSGRSLACWSRSGTKDNTRESSIWCGLNSGDGSWTKPFHIGGGNAVVEGFPAVTGTARGWGLLSYQSDSSGTRVILRRLDESGQPRTSYTLAEVELPVDEFCPAESLPCRRDPALFFPGDYVAISASGEDFAAAYILPRGGDPTLESQVWVSVVR